MSRIALTNGQILTPNGSFVTAALVMEGSKISGIATGELPGDIRRIDVNGCYVVPGFIDTHTHGCGGRNFMEGSREAISAISRQMTRSGVTSCLVTTTSAPLESLLPVLEYAVFCKGNRRSGELEILGVHMEGPFINPKFRGAHSEPYIRPATVPELEALLAAAGPALRVVTLAPEMPGGIETVRFFTERGVNVSIGHTGATYEETKLALSSGASRGTHLFNAMPGIHHRDPGPVTALLEDSNAFLELIVDGYHIHPAVVGMVVRQTGPHRVVLITDSADVSGLGEGRFRRWEGTEVIVKNGKCSTHGGSLAGSVLRMDQGVKNLVEQVGLSLTLALRMASENPARSVGVYDRKGSLAPGKDADVVVLRKDLSVLLTIAGGLIAYDAKVEGGFPS